MSTLTLYQPRLPTKHILALSAIVLIIFTAIRAIPQPHAEDRHGPDAVAIRNCLDHNGPAWHEINKQRIQYWQSKDDPNTFYQTCLLDDGRWGFQAVIKQNNKWWEKTGFVKGKGTLGELLKYLAQNGRPFTGSPP